VAVSPKVLTWVPIRFTSPFLAGEGRLVEEEIELGADQQTPSRSFFALLSFPLAFLSRLAALGEE
jgi:hypothetical protein